MEEMVLRRYPKHCMKRGCNVIGVPKTIDNDLSATDLTFGFRTAVQVATEAVDKLVTTAASHNRVMILEVMGRSAGWIALHAAIAGGAEVCIIPEVPYDISKVLEAVHGRFEDEKGFAIIVAAEGAMAKGGSATTKKSEEVGYHMERLGGIAYKLADELRSEGLEAGVRVTVLGHLQRGGVPIAFDRILASQFGVRAFEMVLEGQFGQMVAIRGEDVMSVPLKDATEKYNFVNTDSNLVRTARGIGISFGD